MSLFWWIVIALIIVIFGIIGISKLVFRGGKAVYKKGKATIKNRKEK